MDGSKAPTSEATSACLHNVRSGQHRLKEKHHATRQRLQWKQLLEVRPQLSCLSLVPTAEILHAVQLKIFNYAQRDSMLAEKQPIVTGFCICMSALHTTVTRKVYQYNSLPIRAVYHTFNRVMEVRLKPLDVQASHNIVI
jgi:hypothetical protein